MDPLSIISGCAGLITAIGSLSISINTFVRSCREARSDLDRVSRELHSLQTVLELIEEDAKDDTKPFPPTIQHHVSGIVSNCGSVVLEVETCIKKYGDGHIKSRASWAINGQGDMEKLRSSLEAHKSALELALDMISLSLTKDIKVDTTEIRNDTTTIKDDTALILQEIAQLQARLPDTVASPNDYILQKFLEDMATYTETTLDVDVSYSDGMSSRALSIVDEHYHSSPKSPRYDLPILGPQYPAALVASQSSDSSNPGDALKNGINHPASSKSHNHGHGHWPRPTREDILHRPKGPGPVSSWPEVFFDKEVALGNDPQAPRSSALASDSRIEETQNQIAPSLVRVHQGDSHKKSVLSEFARLDTFDPLWRERYGDYLHGKRLSNDAIRENQEFVIGLLNEVKKDEMLSYSQQNYPLPSMDDKRRHSDRGQPLPSIRGPQHADLLNSTSHRSLQQLMPYMVPIRRPIPTEEDDIVKLSYSTKGLSSQEEYHIQRFRGNVVVDLPVPDRILNLVPHSSPPGRDEFTHSRFSFITCPPEVFGNRNYTLRATLFAQPRQTQFILVMQLDPNDKDFVLRWNFIHDSIVYAQQKHQASGTSQEFWKRVIVHLHLAHGTQWGARSSDHPLNVLESIGAKQTINAKVTRIDSEYLDEPIEEGSSTIGGHMVHAIMSEYTVQLRQLGFPPGTVVPAEVPIQVVITSARAPENFPTLHWSNKFIPWTCAINEAVQAQHVIDMSEFSDALLTETNFLWEVLRRDRSLLVSKRKPFPTYDLYIFRFDSLILELQFDSLFVEFESDLSPRASSKEKKSKEWWTRWFK
ncbi:hypothetical protein DER44DRAFT_761006 [Fusarium oxysporum]|nr:hypothetical protein DER44DRAFT_761006 [Fusarium oxysporum]